MIESNQPVMGVIWYPAERVALSSTPMSVVLGKGNGQIQPLGWSFTYDFLLFLQIVVAKNPEMYTKSLRSFLAHGRLDS